VSEGQETWIVSKPAVTARRGVVASQHHAASQVGAEVLAAGGNAVDAAVAAGLALGAVEPWMSGLGGGGYLLAYLARERRVVAVDFGMVAPRALEPADYPLAEGTDRDLFGWPRVVDDRNVRGPLAMAVPGMVAGLALALERYGTRSWAQSIAPALELAEAGLPVDWYATLRIATEARELAADPEAARVYLPGGYPPAAWGGGGPPPRMHLGRLAETLRRLAAAGPEDFYTGEIAEAIAADLSRLGARLAGGDLASYRPSVHEAGSADYRGATVHVAPGLNGGPSLLRALALLAPEALAGDAPDAATYRAYARALETAYAERLERLGEGAEAARPACTTHLGVADREGNLVALTQTLLSIFGARVMLPETGILMNNGIMWFDPRPARPNSIAPGRRPLANMCPSIVERRDGSRFALGASGGRRIMPAVLQLVSFLVDYGMDLDRAFTQPRIDASGAGVVAVDARLPEAVRAAVAEAYPVERGVHGVYPALFACPNAVGRLASGHSVGAAFIPSPWAQACAEPETAVDS